MQFTAEELQAITTTCTQMGNKLSASLVLAPERCHIFSATAHAYTDEAVLHAIRNGVTAIEHGNLISKATAQLSVIYYRD